MATFADFVLLRAVTSYGGAEVLRARRVLGTGEGTPIHLALLGQDARVVDRIAAVAAAAALAAHDQVARIHEVGRYEGEGYAVADAVDGVELGAILEHERRKKGVPDLALSLAIAHQLAQLAVDLQERGDVWAVDAGVGLSALFPAGLRLDGVVLRADGKVAVRVLAGAGQDPARPTPYRAPELHKRGGGPSVSSDVFVVTQVLRALLTGDASATSAPRLAPAAANLGGMLAAGLAPNPDERLSLFVLVERLLAALGAAAPKAKSTVVIAGALKREYKALAPDGAPDVPAVDVPGLRLRLGAVRRSLQIVWPNDDEEGTPTNEDRKPTAVHSPFARASQADVPSAIDRVFADPPPQTVAGRRKSGPPPQAVVLELTMADEPTTARRPRFSGNTQRGDPTSESDSEPPWLASNEAALIEPNTAPVIDPSEIEAGPTTESRPPSFDDLPSAKTTVGVMDTSPSGLGGAIDVDIGGDDDDEPITVKRPRGS